MCNIGCNTICKSLSAIQMFKQTFIKTVTKSLKNSELELGKNKWVNIWDLGLKNHPNSREIFVTIFVVWHKILTKTRYTIILDINTESQQFTMKMHLTGEN